MKKTVAVLLAAIAQMSVAQTITNWQLQVVNQDGVGVHSSLYGTTPVTVEGYILNRPEYMLDGTPNYNTIAFNVGGQWQMFIQGGEDDHAGTAIWIGQNYQNLTFAGGVGRHTNDEWVELLGTLNHDPHTGHRFMPGDRVRVTGLTRFFGGKTNINRRHNTGNTVTIELVYPGAGMPEPELITLDEIKDENDLDIFDPNRLAGGEYYQARLVRINGVSFVNPELWGPNAVLTITDGDRTLPVKLGIGPGITAGSNNLPEVFDVIGIMNQEGPPNTDNYLLWVTNYDGNGRILADGCDLYGVFSPADLNKDCMADFLDFAIFAAQWLVNTNPLLEVLVQ